MTKTIDKDHYKFTFGLVGESNVSHDVLIDKETNARETLCGIREGKNWIAETHHPDTFLRCQKCARIKVEYFSFSEKEMQTA